MDSRFCVEALQEAIDTYGIPGIFNTDQGSQCTSYEFTNTLKEAGIKPPNKYLNGRSWSLRWTTCLSNDFGDL